MSCISYDSGYVLPFDCYASGYYTFSFLDTAGELHSSTFYFDWDSQLIETDWGSIYVTYDYYIIDEENDFGSDIFYLALQPSKPLSLVYMEIVEGKEPNTGHRQENFIYASGDIDGPTIAIRSTVPVKSWRLGGVRPTVPERGDVWCMIENERIVSSQIYNGFAWVECEIRIWTDQERWISSGYYNVLTQQDFYDIAGTTDNDYIHTTEGFYGWFTKQWAQLLEILQTINSRLEKLSQNSSTNVELNFNIDGTIDVTFTKLANDGRSGVLKIIYTFWELIFVDVWEGASGALDDLSAVYGRDQTEFKIGEDTGWSVWAFVSGEEMEGMWECSEPS